MNKIGIVLIMMFISVESFSQLDTAVYFLPEFCDGEQITVGQKNIRAFVVCYNDNGEDTKQIETAVRCECTLTQYPHGSAADSSSTGQSNAVEYTLWKAERLSDTKWTMTDYDMQGNISVTYDVSENEPRNISKIDTRPVEDAETGKLVGVDIYKYVDFKVVK
ncbi:MAG: hypothetical protein JKY52_15500 [Flavobacteriales bacterium]|nr:hypothetical protein [Flavobacteriales bacterium]